jgi:hypothetical protein
MSNSLLFIPDSKTWHFDSKAVVERLRSVWPSAKVSRTRSGLFSYEFWVESTALLVKLGDDMIDMNTSTGINEAARVAFEAAQTAPTSLRFFFMDDGNTHALAVTRETPFAAYQRLLDAGPLRE